MTNIVVTIRDGVATAKLTGILTNGMVGVPVFFDLGPEWEDLTVVAVIRGNDLTFDRPLLGTRKTTVPFEVLEKVGEHIYIGAEGCSASGDLVIQSNMAKVEESVRQGADPSGDLAMDPTKPFWAEVMEKVEHLQEIGGISDTEKRLMLSLFKNAAYTANMSATIARLEALWSGNVPDVPDEPVGTVYTVTNNLTNVTNSNPQTEVTEGFYSATLRAEDGYTIEATITMGGVDITANVFTAETGTILITAVTGNIVITATAKLASMPVLYRLAGTPKSVSGLAEDTGLAFGSNDASGVANAWSICVAYTGFGPSETLLKMSSGSALNAATNGAGNNSKIRITCCGNVADALSGESANNDYRFVITREKSSLKMISIHYLENGAVKTVTNTGTYGQFNVDVQAGNLLVGSSDIMVNDLTIYKGVLSDAAIATYLGGGEI